MTAGDAPARCPETPGYTVPIPVRPFGVVEVQLVAPAAGIPLIGTLFGPGLEDHFQCARPVIDVRGEAGGGVASGDRRIDRSPQWP